MKLFPRQRDQVLMIFFHFELRHEMIHVQNWKIYASHDNDDSTDLGFELKQAQLHYKQYGEEMGVPVTDEIVSTATRPSVDDIFPFLFEGTSIHDYNQAQFIERNKNCITIREWQEREVKYADSDFGETCCVDDLFDNTHNYSDEMIGDLLNDMYTKDDSGIDDTPMKKKQLFEYETPFKPSNYLLIFKNWRKPILCTVQYVLWARPTKVRR